MVSSCVTRNVFTVIHLFLLVILSTTPLSSSQSSFLPSAKVNKLLVDILCSKPPIYKHFCVAWLTSDPKTFTLDLHGLTVNVILKTQLFGLKNLELMKGLAQTTTDPKLKEPYASCVTYYEVSDQAIQRAKGFAISKDYESAYDHAFKASDNIAECEGLLEQLSPPYVSTRNLWFERMCDMSRVFSGLLEDPLC